VRRWACTLTGVWAERPTLEVGSTCVGAFTRYSGPTLASCEQEPKRWDFVKTKTRRIGAIVLAIALSMGVGTVVGGPANATEQPVEVILTPDAPEGDPGAKIISTWRDFKNQVVELRQGTWNNKNGFGFKKINSKHHVYKVSTVRYPTRNNLPGGYLEKGTKRQYVAYANRKVCTRTGCKIVQQIPVLTVVQTQYFTSYWGVQLRSNPGVITTYCKNPNGSEECPTWVDASFSGGLAESDSIETEEGTVSAVWSFTSSTPEAAITTFDYKEPDPTS
jgi:hypothetical protein